MLQADRCTNLKLVPRTIMV